MKTIRNILVATDLSPASRPAMREAIAMAAARDADLWIAHVVAPPTLAAPEPYILPRVFDEMNAAIQDDARRRLRAWMLAARRSGARAKGLLLAGAPADALVRAARRHRADLIVVGTHGRTGIGRLIFGSVAARVVATSSCPVLTVRERAPARRSAAGRPA